MKFSVLLPTRNRLEYLKYAIETVRQQDYSNWEIIVSDNDSSEDLLGFINLIGDSRIKYFRTGALIPVTDNWNNALIHSDGDYVIMLGDDDGLMPKYFSSILNAFKVHPNPDFVYVGGYFFAYRGAVEQEPNGYLRIDKNQFSTKTKPFLLTKDEAITVSKGYTNFNMPVASNMQFSLISRRMIAKLSIDGPFFRSPFPDFYATPLLFLSSKSVLIYPEPLVIVGITPKSYGAFHFGGKSTDGANFLQNQGSLRAASLSFSDLLPGTTYYDSWYLAMKELEKIYINTGDHRVHININKYRFLQIIHVYKGYYFDQLFNKESINVLRARMTLVERFFYEASLPFFFVSLKFIPGKLKNHTISFLRRLIGQHAIKKEGPQLEQGCINLLEVYELFNKTKSVID